MLCTVLQAVHYFQETIDHRLLDISKVLNILSDQKKDDGGTCHKNCLILR